MSPRVIMVVLMTLHSALQMVVEVQGPQEEPTTRKGGRWMHPEQAPSAWWDGHGGPHSAQLPRSKGSPRLTLVLSGLSKGAQ